MSKKVRQADIAKRLNVSIVTVSKALAGKEGVGKELRRKILEVAGELGYKLSEEGLERADDHEFSISIIVSEQYMTKYGSFYSEISHEVSSYILNHGNFSYTEVITGSMEENLVLPTLVDEHKVQGIVVIGRLDKEYLNHLMKEGSLPCVMIDFYEADFDTDYIISDSYYGAYTLTRHLIQKGHRKISYVGTVSSTGSIIDRFHGYLKAISEIGIPYDPKCLLDDRDKKTGKLFTPEEFVLPKEMPTAFFCNCDITAGRLIKRLNMEGIRVPEDVSVVGYDNYIYPDSCDISLTTYEVDVKAMSQTAASTIIKKLNNRSLSPRMHIIEGHMIERDSVKDLTKE